jgi:hypothetical protein
MFQYDPQLAASTQTPPQSITEVLQLLHTIDTTCLDSDGLKWFNWLYLQVTQAVQDLVNVAGFHDAAWLLELDVQFAKFYCTALHGYLTGGSCPNTWATLFSVRDNVRLARVQFALSGVNAHINHDLPAAIVTTCERRDTPPRHGTPQYEDYTSVNTPLGALIENAKKELHVRLLGDPLPPVSHIENTIAAWKVKAAREQAWNHAQALWHLRHFPLLVEGYLDGLDGLTTFGNKALLVEVH